MNDGESDDEAATQNTTRMSLLNSCTRTNVHINKPFCCIHLNSFSFYAFSDFHYRFVV